MGFWKNVDDELKYSGMTRKELATKANFPDSYISKGIKRNSIPAADLALRISHALHTSLETLLELPQNENEKSSEQNRNFLRQWGKLSKAQQQKLIEFLETVNE